MSGAERNGKGYLRVVSEEFVAVEFVAVEFVAVTQQHAGQDKETCKTKSAARMNLRRFFII